MNKVTVSLDTSSPLEIAPRFRFQWEEAQTSFVLLYPEGMITLNQSASEILKHCDGTSTANGIIEKLQHTFPDADLESDVREFLENAYAAGWIRTRHA